MKSGDIIFDLVMNKFKAFSNILHSVQNYDLILN